MERLAEEAILNVMKTSKNVFLAVAFIALPVLTFFAHPARAEGMHGVRETATEILVEVPRFCRPVKFVWEILWEQNATNEEAILSFVHRDEKKLKTLSLQTGRVRVETVWRGGETVRIQKFDAKGKPIKINRLSFFGMGDEMGDLSQDNWGFILDRGIPKNISPPVRVGTWGKCK